MRRRGETQSFRFRPGTRSLVYTGRRCLGRVREAVHKLNGALGTRDDNTRLPLERRFQKDGHALVRLRRNGGPANQTRSIVSRSSEVGRIDAPFFDRKSADWRREQGGILRNIQVHQDADQSYIEDGIQLLELASDAHELFLEQEPREKRRLLAFMVSSASWKEGGRSALCP